jgi:hypothetical protein
MSILSELKKLTGKNNATVVSEALPPQLPVPGRGDEGKVPTVQSDGSYALANAGGGSSPLVVTFSGTTDGGDAACDKTWDEIVAAGLNVDVWYKSESSDSILKAGFVNIAFTEEEIVGLSAAIYDIDFDENWDVIGAIILIGMTSESIAIYIRNH